MKIGGRVKFYQSSIPAQKFLGMPESVIGWVEIFAESVEIEVVQALENLPPAHGRVILPELGQKPPELAHKAFAGGYPQQL
jgi:hypothetical protein